MDIDIDLPENICRAGQADWRALADITANAFQDDPVNLWIFGNPLAIRSAFRVLTRHIYAKRGICHLMGDQGAAMWLAHTESANLSRWAQLQLAFGQQMHGDKGSISRALHAGEALAAHHPSEPHLYLFTVGIAKRAQGQGLGRKLLQPTLEACDRTGMPVYLENSNPDNFGFYSALGFEHVEHFKSGIGGPPLQAMWRSPK